MKLPTSGATSDAIAVDLDHRDDDSVEVLYPYAIRDGELDFGEAFAQSGEGRIFQTV